MKFANSNSFFVAIFRGKLFTVHTDQVQVYKIWESMDNCFHPSRTVSRDTSFSVIPHQILKSTSATDIFDFSEKNGHFKVRGRQCANIFPVSDNWPIPKL